jgi:transcriptional regulator with XRE-family HTH domain
MAATFSNGSNDWYSDRRSSTGMSSGANRTAVLAAIMLVGAGTGVFVDDLEWLQQHRLNDGVVNRTPIMEVVLARTPAENLERVRAVFSPAVTELANLFSVSRQTVYNWLNGDQLRPEHITKLQDIAHAADIVAETGIPMTGALLKRKVIEGKNLFEVARDGGSTRDAAQLLVQIVRREAGQREMMAARFAGRKHTLRSADSDFPAENDKR